MTPASISLLEPEQLDLGLDAINEAHVDCLVVVVVVVMK